MVTVSGSHNLYIYIEMVNRYVIYLEYTQYINWCNLNASYIETES